MAAEASEDIDKDESQAGSKKKVHFEEQGKNTKPKQKSNKTSRKKTVQSKDESNEAQSANEEKNSMKDTGGKPKSKKKQAKIGDKGTNWKKISSKLKDQTHGEKSSGKKKKATADVSKKWPFVDFDEQLKMDTANKDGGAGNRNTYSPLDINKTNIATVGLMRTSNVNLPDNFETLDVLSAIDDQQNRRHREHIQSQLNVIQKRVHKTLEDYGMDDESDEEEELLRLPAVKTFDTNSERKKMEERNYVIDRIDKFEEKALVRKQYLTEMMHWFEDHLNMCHDVVTPEELKEMIQTSSELHSVISKSLAAFIANGDLVVEKGKLLLEETSKIIEERKAQMAKKTRKERIIVYDDNLMLADPTKWESASKTILSVFEDSHKMIKNLMYKNAIRLCQKQFDYMMTTYDTRVKELDDKKRQCLDLQGKLHSAKMQSDKLGREIEEQKRKFSKQFQELSDTKSALQKLEAKNKEMHDKIVELKSNIKFLQAELRQKNKTPTPPPTPSPPPSPEKVYVKVVDSSTELKLQEVEQELEDAKKEIEKYLAELKEVKELYQTEKEKSKGLMGRISMLEKEAQDKPVPPPELSVADQVMTEAKRLPDGADKDVSYYKTLMTGMKKEFEAELEKVRSHVRKEKTRGDASIKKMEFLHKDQLTNIHKDTVRMLRGIMHFREHMIVCFEKENLIDQAQALHDLGDIVKDKLSPDPKEVLATIVGTVVDYMNKMEGILSNAFLALRVLMKYQIDRQVEAEVQHRMAMKEVQKKAREMKAPKKNVNNLAKSLKKAKNKLKKAKQNINAFATDKKYLELLSRYNNMMKLYKGMQKEMEVLQCDFHDTMQKKLEEKETMMISQMKMEMKQKRAQVEEHLKMSMADHKQNLKMLSIAYEKNKISKELHMMATAMIQKTMEIPQRKLKTLFEKYITYRTIKDSKERVARVLKDEKANLSVDTREEMEQYIHTIDGKFRQGMKKWKEEMKELDNEKIDLNKRIYNLFSEVLVETGVLFVHPLLRDKNKTVRITKAASNMNRTRVRDILFKRKKRCKEFLLLPDELLGKSISIGQGDANKLWNQKIAQSSRGTGANVVLPHMMAYDVNKPRIEASRAFSVKRQNYNIVRTESFNICQQNYVQYIRDSTPNSQEIVWNKTVCIS